jgi:hypothetical protein
MAELRHAPYAGTDPPMIGLKASISPNGSSRTSTLPASWPKSGGCSRAHSEVYARRPDSRPAQAEVLALLAEHLPRVHPETYRRDGSRIRSSRPASPSRSTIRESRRSNVPRG